MSRLSLSLISEWLLSVSLVGSVHSMDPWDKGAIHILGGTEQDSTRFHPTTQNAAQLKTYELFISGSFHVKFSDHDRL